MIGGLLAAGTVGLIWGVVYFASPREPTYQGKTLSEWIVPFCRQTAKGLDAPGGPEHFEELRPVRQAVRQIGTNGVPFLIARLNHHESGLHRTARQLSEKLPYASLRLTDPNVSKIRAIRALANLGRDARPAIPSLKTQLMDITLSEHAVYALSGMGVEGTRALIEQYTNVPVQARLQITMTIVTPESVFRGEPMGISSVDEFFGSFVEGLSWVAQQPTSQFRILAIQRLGFLKSKASNAVPALLMVLSAKDPVARQAAARALGQINGRPELVIPALTNLLNDPDSGTQSAVAQALRAFGYDAPIPSQGTRPIWPLAPGRTNSFRSL